jgi:hypothetical protein
MDLEAESMTNKPLYPVLCFLGILCCSLRAEPAARIVVEAAQHVRVDVPVSVSIEGLGETELLLEELTAGSRRPVPVQIEKGDVPRLWWVLDGTTEAGGKRVFELSTGRSYIEKSSEIAVEKSDSFIEFSAGGHDILRYNHAVMPPPQGMSQLYERSGFIHPAWSPKGSVLTAIHPPDHIHHMGIWMPWTKTSFKGRDIDFWNIGDGTGTVRFAGYISTTSGPVFGGFKVKQEHVVLGGDDGEEVALNEIWDVRVYNVGGPEKGYRLWDLVSTQTCASDEPLYQHEYRYGGIGYRATLDWKGDNCDYLTSEGMTKLDGHATRARWCDMYGVTDGEYKGLTVFSSPENFRHPEPMRLWPADMEYIFFNFCPSQVGNWKMEPDKEHVFRYRFFVHEGKPDVARIERVWYDYAEPPTVKIEKL